jgi:hypothetical protein
MFIHNRVSLAYECFESVKPLIWEKLRPLSIEGQAW